MTVAEETKAEVDQDKVVLFSCDKPSEVANDWVWMNIPGGRQSAMRWNAPADDTWLDMTANRVELYGTEYVFTDAEAAEFLDKHPHKGVLSPKSPLYQLKKSLKAYTAATQAQEEAEHALTDALLAVKEARKNVGMVLTGMAEAPEGAVIIGDLVCILTAGEDGLSIRLEKLLKL